MTKYIPEGRPQPVWIDTGCVSEKRNLGVDFLSCVLIPSLVLLLWGSDSAVLVLHLLAHQDRQAHQRNLSVPFLSRVQHFLNSFFLLNRCLLE